MLKRWLILLGLAASGLVAASCAETGSTIAAAEARHMAELAATQAYGAATQMLIAATQEATDAVLSMSLPQFQNSLDQRTYIIELPKATVVIKNGQETVIMKPAPLWDADGKSVQ